MQDRAVVGMLSGRVCAPRLSGDSANLLAGLAVDADPDVLVGDRAVAEDHTEQPCDVSGDIRPIWKRFDRTCIGGTIEGDEQITDLELIQACPFVAKDSRRSFVDPGVAVDLPPSEVSRAHPTSINSVGAVRDRAGGVLAGTVGNTARREPCPRSRLAVCGLPSPSQPPAGTDSCRTQRWSDPGCVPWRPPGLWNARRQQPGVPVARRPSTTTRGHPVAGLRCSSSCPGRIRMSREPCRDRSRRLRHHRTIPA